MTDRSHDQMARAREAGTAKYTLATAILIVRKFETTPTRTAVFAEIKAKNRIFRTVDWIYRKSGASALQRLAMFLYMLKCVASITPMPARSAGTLAIAGFANEVRAIERVAAIVPDVEIAVLQHARRNMIRLGQLAPTLRMLARLPRCWRMLGMIARRYSFMPAFRIASALAYYIRCREILDAHQAINAALTSSNYSPDALGLSAAAHARGLSVIYVNHAPVPQNSPVVPPVLADCSVFNGDAARETYARRSRYLSETVLIGLPGAAKPFSLRDEVAAIGIFLTALTRTETIERLVDELRDSSPGIRILIRHHPVALLETDLSTMTARHNGIEVTLGTPLDDDITACDLIFCGNSGAALDVLRGGCPVAYLPELDRLPVDFNGFLEDGLVPRVDGWSPGLYASLKSFYGAPDWADRMRKHDASYGVSREELEAAARVRLVTHLSGQSSVERLDFRAEAIGAGSAQRHLPASSIPHQDQDGCSKYSLG